MFIKTKFKDGVIEYIEVDAIGEWDALYKNNDEVESGMIVVDQIDVLDMRVFNLERDLEDLINIFANVGKKI